MKPLPSPDGVRMSTTRSPMALTRSFTAPVRASGSVRYRSSPCPDAASGAPAWSFTMRATASRGTVRAVKPRSTTTLSAESTRISPRTAPP